MNKFTEFTDWYDDPVIVDLSEVTAVTVAEDTARVLTATDQDVVILWLRGGGKIYVRGDVDGLRRLLNP